MRSLVVNGQQIKKKQKGHNAYIITKYPSLNRVNSLKISVSLFFRLGFQNYRLLLAF